MNCHLRSLALTGWREFGMMHLVVSLLVVAPVALLVDICARPRSVKRLRSAQGSFLLVQIALFIFGILLFVSGNAVLAAVLVLAVNLLFVVASNAKNDMLGEPLLFSDLALIGAVFRHPQFYLSALERSQKLLGLVALAVLVAAFVWLFEANLVTRLIGLGISLTTAILMRISLETKTFKALASEPDADADVAKLGLASTLLLYWIRWRGDAEKGTSSATDPYVSDLIDASECSPNAEPEIIVVIQCESFADPVELFGKRGVELSNLKAAKKDAVLWGNLLVSGFGAYTMRTEYGVLFGREEDDLGFRRYDPYLTALKDGALALPNRLGGDRWRSVFVHPHDMRFYSRHRILPEAGFSQLIDDSEFDRPSSGDGRYISDAALAAKILEVARITTERTFIYAVTIENHGPWSSEGEPLVAHYNRLVQAGDSMLGQLCDGIAELGKPALLAFFGDHRPSIPGASMPGGDRHTPYAVLRFDAAGRAISGGNQRKDLTPAQLHHAILSLGKQWRKKG